MINTDIKSILLIVAVCVISFILWKWVKAIQEIKETNLRFYTYKKRTDEELSILKSNAKIKDSEDVKNLFNILERLFRFNPVGILDTEHGKIVRRSFEIKKAGKAECRRRIKQGTDVITTRRITNPVQIAFEVLDYKEFITKEDLLLVFKQPTAEKAIEVLTQRICPIKEAN